MFIVYENKIIHSEKVAYKRSKTTPTGRYLNM